MNRLLHVIALTIILGLSASCSRQPECGMFHAVDASGWLYGDTLRYDIAPVDSVTPWHGDIAIAVRHSASYPYSNLWMEVSYPPADSVPADTINVILADTYGNWLGNGLGLSFMRVDTVFRNITVASPTTLSVRHIMRSDRLPDVEQIGLIYITR